MKGMIFSINDESYKNNYKRPIDFFLISDFCRRNGVFIFYVFLFLVGIVSGCISFKKIDMDSLEKFNLFFMTNVSERLKFTPLEIFTTSLAADFIFVFISFLFAFAAWGIFLIPLLCVFKGFGLGLCSSLLFSELSFSGIAFLILVILPGTVLFLFAYIIALKESFLHSFATLKMYFPSVSDVQSMRRLKPFFYRYFIVLIFTVLSAFIDMILWVLFANLFNF